RAATIKDSMRLRPQAELARLYDEWYDQVLRWVRALSGLHADSEDITQEVFLVVHRKLHTFDGVNMPAWLYRIAQLQVMDHAKRAWVKRVLGRRKDVVLDDLPERGEGSAMSIEQHSDRRTLHHVLSKLPAERRAAFVMYEVFGYTCAEIAGIQDVPV